MLDRAADDLAYLRDLYDRFRKEVLAGGQIDYYEKDELLDIYDYAQDEGDVMTQFFVFLTAARLFPDDHSFDDRAGFFLSYLSTDAATDMLARAQRDDTPLWAVLEIGVKNFPDGDPEKDVDALLQRYDSIDTEAIIKLIDLLRDMNRLDILAKRADRLRAVAEDSESLIYELAAGLSDKPEHTDLARTLLDELTKSEPFNCQDWVLLARVEFNAHNYDEALQALDYAAAIDPANPEALTLRGLLLASWPDDPSRQTQGRKILRQHLKASPDDREAALALAASLKDKGDVSGAITTLHSFLKQVPADAEVLSKILELDPDDPSPYIKTFIKGGSRLEDDWLFWARHLANECDLPNQACVLLSCYNYNYGLSRGLEYFVILLYTVGLYNEVIGVVDSVMSRHEQDEKDGKESPSVFSIVSFTIYAAALLMAKNYDRTLQITHELLNMEPVDLGCDLTRMLQRQGCIHIIKAIDQYARHPETIPTVEDFEPVYELLIRPTSPVPKNKKK